MRVAKGSRDPQQQFSDMRKPHDARDLKRRQTVPLIPFHLCICIILMTSNQSASSLLLLLYLLLPGHRLDLLGEDGLHGLIEHVLEALLGESTALDVLAVQLLLDHLRSVLPRDRRILGVLSLEGVLLPLIDFVTHEDLWHIANDVLQLRVPLHTIVVTFLTALVKEAGSTTEKMIRKTSALG